MPSDITVAIGHGIAVLIESYAAYWALNIWNALRVRLYRNQALGMALVSLAFVALDLAQVLITILSIPGNVFFPVLFVVFIVTFYWIDASALAARRSDPLLRDTLHWSKARIVIWSVLIMVSIADFALVFSLPSSLQFGSGLSQNASSPAILLFGLFFFLPVLMVPISGAVLLSTAARRSMDRVFRRHIRWFGIFVILLSIIVVITSFSLPFWEAILAYPFIFAAGYSLYRSARSLVPLNQLSEEVEARPLVRK